MGLGTCGDGDISVYLTLLTNVPEWDQTDRVHKSCLCYRSSLEKMVRENPSHKGKGGLAQKMHKRLTSAARCAIKMRSQEPDTKKAVKLLEQGLMNGPLHCSGFHSKCSKGDT